MTDFSFNSDSKQILDILDCYIKDENIYNFFSSLDARIDTDTSNSNFDPANLPEHKIDISRRIKIENVITFGAKYLTKHKYADLLFNLGKLSISLGEFPLAKDLFVKIISNPVKADYYESYTAFSYYNLAKIKVLQAEWKECLEYLNKAKSTFLSNKDSIGLTDYFLLLGNMYLNTGNLNKAKKAFEKGGEYVDQINDKYFLGLIDNNIGIIHASQNEFDEALTYFYRALSYQQQLDNSNKISEIRNNLGLLFTLKDDNDTALGEFDLSIQSGLKNDYLISIAMAYVNKSVVYCRTADYKFANAYSDKAMELAIRLNDKLTIADVYKVKGMIERELNNFSISENHLLTSLRLNADIKNKYNYAECAYEIGLLYVKWQNIPQAFKYLKKAYDYYVSINAKLQEEKINTLLNNISRM